jgi:hypothetical protein
MPRSTDCRSTSRLIQPSPILKLFGGLSNAELRGQDDACKAREH